jgi:hypothetical protein
VAHRRMPCVCTARHAVESSAPAHAPLSLCCRMALSPFFKSMRDSHATERTVFMRNALRSPRYGVEFGGNLCLVALISFAFAVM